LYALVNTMSGTRSAGGSVLGRILSIHRTISKAEAESSIVLKRVRRNAGKNCYLPLLIVRLRAHKSKLDLLRTSEFEPIEWGDP